MRAPLLFLISAVLVACAARTALPPIPSSGAETTAADPRWSEPPEADRAACRAARQRLRKAVTEAAAGCASDDDCDIFQTCAAVTRASTPALWKLDSEANVACRHIGDSFLSCARSRVVCTAGRCGF